MKDLLVDYLDDPTPERLRALRAAVEDEITAAALFLLDDIELSIRVADAVFAFLGARLEGAPRPARRDRPALEDIVRAVPGDEAARRGLGVKYPKAAALIVAVALARHGCGSGDPAAAAAPDRDPEEARLADLRRSILALPRGAAECAALLYAGHLEAQEVALLFGLDGHDAAVLIDWVHGLFVGSLSEPTRRWLAGAVEEETSGDSAAKEEAPERALSRAEPPRR
jgi:hypothetical protein